MPEEKTKEVIELQVPTTLKSLIEALIFAAKEPLTVKQMKDIYEGDGPQSYLRQLDADEVEASINELNADYEKDEKAYRIIRIAGGFQFATTTKYADWIGRLYKEQGRRKLSQSGIESLAIVAYKQPVTKADIESIRGVNCDYVLKTLLEKELVTVVGRAHAPGRPLLYGTTREFLKHFGLNEITDLPRPREIEEILGESQFETERRMLESQAGAEKMKSEEPEFKSRLPHIPKKKAGLDSEVEIKTRNSQLEIKTIERTEKSQNNDLELPIEKEVPRQVNLANLDLSKEQVSRDAEGVLTSELPASSSAIEPATEPEIPVETVAVPTQIQESTGSLSAGTEAPGSEPKTVENQSFADSAEKSEVQPSTTDRGELQVEDVQPERAPGEEMSRPVANKSKWKTWKEKVQGFIRKIFG